MSTPRRLAEAARNGDLAEVNKLIAQGAPLDAKWLWATDHPAEEATLGNEDWKTPLHHAVCFNHQDVVRALLAAGADVNMAAGVGVGRVNGGDSAAGVQAECVHFFRLEPSVLSRQGHPRSVPCSCFLFRGSADSIVSVTPHAACVRTDMALGPR